MNAAGPIRSSSDTLAELAEVIGQAQVLALCKSLGGTKIYIPATIGHNHPIAVAIGLRAAARLAEHYYGTQIDLPKAHLRRERVIELARSGEMTIAEAARACDFTERHVYRLIAADQPDEVQLDLFST